MGMCCYFFLLIFVASGFCFLLNAEDDKKYIDLFFSSPDSEDVLLFENNTNLIDVSKVTIFLVHGWIENEKTNYYPAMAAEFHKKGGYNVIKVNWERYAKVGYLTAMQLLKRVGEFIASYIDILAQNGVELSKVHIVGHSLGAHVAGVAGKRIKAQNGTLGRISGLDPAGPLFFSFTERLEPDDATMVDCLYTNRGFYGTLSKLGTHNFYANDATHQPGCPLDNDNKTKPLFCSHQRSTSLFTESINSNKFIAVKIRDFSTLLGALGTDNSVKVIYGENTNATDGSYHFKTKPSEPYALD